MRMSSLSILDDDKHTTLELPSEILMLKDIARHQSDTICQNFTLTL